MHTLLSYAFIQCCCLFIHHVKQQFECTPSDSLYNKFLSYLYYTRPGDCLLLIFDPLFLSECHFRITLKGATFLLPNLSKKIFIKRWVMSISHFCLSTVATGQITTAPPSKIPISSTILPYLQYRSL